MSREELVCEICEEQGATVHVTHMTDAEILKFDLCEQCAKDAGVNDPTGFSLLNLLSSVKKLKRAKRSRL